MGTKNLNQDEINEMLSAMQISSDDEPDADSKSEDLKNEQPKEKTDELTEADQATAADPVDSKRQAAADAQNSREPDDTQADQVDSPPVSTETDPADLDGTNENGEIDKSGASAEDKEPIPADSRDSDKPTDASETDPEISEQQPQPRQPSSNKALKEIKTRKRKNNRKAVWITVAVCTLLFLVPISIHISNVKEDMAAEAKEEALAAANQQNVPEKDPSKDTEPDSGMAPVEQDPMKLAFVKQLSEMEILREELLIKEGEIADLKQQYELGINAVEDEIIRIKTRDRIRSFQQAQENESIELNLRTIQRRRAYIQGLDRPANWLHAGGEELLFQIRKTRIDLMVADTTEGIDLAGLLQANDRIIDQYALNAQKLAVIVKTEDGQNLDKIWDSVLQREKETILSRLAKNRPARAGSKTGADTHNRNRQIWNEMCDGNFNLKNEVTELSPQAANCLAHWKDTDLFLNGICDLSPAAARNLFAWKGNWICLNGFRDLAPDVARYLFQWDGQWISLNGLASLSFEATMYLPHWKGKKLELMGLKSGEMIGDPLALKHLAQWEKTGGTLYVSEKVRELIQMVN